jgi:hypothetical protein
MTFYVTLFDAILLHYHVETYYEYSGKRISSLEMIRPVKNHTLISPVFRRSYNDYI